MALNTQLANATANTGANAEAALFNGGFLDIYDGAQPATADTAIGAQVKLVRLTFSSPAFAPAATGVLIANPITQGIASATGTAGWYRVLKADGTTVIADGSVGTTSSFNIQLPTVVIAAGVTVSISSYVHTVAKAAAGF